MALAERLLTEFPKYPTISSIIRLVISCRTYWDAEENQATIGRSCGQRLRPLHVVRPVMSCCPPQRDWYAVGRRLFFAR